jgi:hypothetical protein
MKAHQVPDNLHTRLIDYYGSGSALRKALQHNPYGPIDNIKRYKLQHAEAVSAALQCNNAGSPERAAAVLQHVLKAETSGSGDCGLSWHQLEHAALKELQKLGSTYGRPWPASQSLRPGTELAVKLNKIVATRRLLRCHSSTAAAAAA